MRHSGTTTLYYMVSPGLFTLAHDFWNHPETCQRTVVHPVQIAFGTLLSRSAKAAKVCSPGRECRESQFSWIIKLLNAVTLTAV